MQNHRSSGCRIIRINKLSDGNYFAWGETYGTTTPTFKGRNIKIIEGGIVGHPELPAIEGVRMFSTDSLGNNNLPTDTLYCVHRKHTTLSDATISATGCELSNRTTSDEVIQYSLPENTTLSSTPVWSPTTFYALPGDSELNYLVVKLSFIYKGVYVYDVRVPIKLPNEGLQAGKYYKYELYITSKGNGTEDPDEARTEKDDVLIKKNPVINVRLVETGYAKGDSRKLTI